MADQNPSRSRVQASRLPGYLAILALLVPVALICGFAVDLAYSETKGPYRIITDVADLDSDGDLDVILGRTRWEAVDISWAGIALWINQGGGQFTSREQGMYNGFAGFAAAGGDVDADEDADLFILDGYALRLSLNRGGAQRGEPGAFETQFTVGRLTGWRGHADMGGSVVLGDLNGDRQVDAFVTGCCYGWTGETALDSGGRIPSSTSVWINARDPQGWPVRHSTTLEPLQGLPIRSAALGDLDGDGDLDAFAAVGRPTLGTSSGLADLVLLNDGVGNLTDSGQRLGESDSYSLALGDADGDGDLDALVGAENGVTLWVNQGRTQGGAEGRFAASAQQFSGSRIRTVFLSDLDGDGSQDALIAGRRQAVIWWNDGQAVFVQSNQRFRFSEPQGPVIGDFDGDGWPDIFAGGHDDDYRVWLNQGDGRFSGK
jgi:hypothetical protein